MALGRLKCCHSERSCCVRHHTTFLDLAAVGSQSRDRKDDGCEDVRKGQNIDESNISELV